MAEIHYAFIKNDRVVNSVVFASENKQLADQIAKEQGYDDAVLCGNMQPYLHASYDGKTFTPPTHEYLISIGILRQAIEEQIN